MKRTLAFLPLLALAALIVGLWSWTPQVVPTPATTGQRAGPVAAATGPGIQSPPIITEQPNAPDERLERAHERLATDLERWRERLQAHQREPGNLQRFFQRLHGRCGDDEALCRELLAQILADYPDADFAQRLRDILPRMPDYRRAIDSMALSGDSDAASRLQAIERIRQQHLGEHDSELLFGQEMALARERIAYGEFLRHEARQMPPGERLAAAEKRRRETLGRYHDSLAQQQGPRDTYERERELRLLDVDDEQQQRRITHELRERHFGPEQAQRMAEHDERRREQQAEVADYQARLAELEAEMEQRRETDPDWEATYQRRLEALRRDAFE